MWPAIGGALGILILVGFTGRDRAARVCREAWGPQPWDHCPGLRKQSPTN